jgi:hypothetical protein
MTGAVVITRPRQQAEPLARAVAALGRETVLLPLLEISPLADDANLRRVLGELASYTLVAFVSPNAIDAAFTHIGAWPAGVDIAVVGEGSRAALAKHGIGSEVRIHCPKDPAFSDSEHLLQALALDQLAGRRVLVVRGEGGRELLPDALRQDGRDGGKLPPCGAGPERGTGGPAARLAGRAERLDNHELGSAARAGVPGRRAGLQRIDKTTAAAAPDRPACAHP